MKLVASGSSIVPSKQVQLRWGTGLYCKSSWRSRSACQDSLCNLQFSGPRGKCNRSCVLQPAFLCSLFSSCHLELVAMSQHPLESSPDSRTFSPAPSDITDEDYGFPDSSSSRASSPLPDNIVRATSPLGRRYLKPINGIQTKGFASSGNISQLYRS